MIGNIEFKIIGQARVDARIGEATEKKTLLQTSIDGRHHDILFGCGEERRQSCPGRRNCGSGVCWAEITVNGKPYYETAVRCGFSIPGLTKRLEKRGGLRNIRLAELVQQGSGRLRSR